MPRLLSAAAHFAAHLPQYRRLYRRYRPFTMMAPRTFLFNLSLVQRLAPPSGCIVECGVWRGGMSAAMSHALPGRKHFLFDSFEGLPPAREIDGAAALAWQRNTDDPNYRDNCRAERSFAERAMTRSAAREYHLVQGWFADTLPAFTPPEPIAVLRIDCDWYEPTWQVLTALYKHVAPNGLILLDDYYTWDGSSRAVHDFLSATKSAARLRNLLGVCYFSKPTEDA